jgi:hypothetical protein
VSQSGAGRHVHGKNTRIALLMWQLVNAFQMPSMPEQVADLESISHHRSRSDYVPHISSLTQDIKARSSAVSVTSYTAIQRISNFIHCLHRFQHDFHHERKRLEHEREEELPQHQCEVLASQRVSIATLSIALLKESSLRHKQQRRTCTPRGASRAPSRTHEPPDHTRAS